LLRNDLIAVLSRANCHVFMHYSVLQVRANFRQQAAWFPAAAFNKKLNI